MSSQRVRRPNKRRNSNTREGNDTSLSILDFRANIADLARPNLFQVTIELPDIIESGGGRRGRGQRGGGKRRQNGNQFTRLSSFLCKAANLPASTIGVIEVPFRGRQLKIAGDRTFEPWTVTILNDEGMVMRSRLEQWANAIQQQMSNYQSADTIEDYQATARVFHTDRQNIHNKAYEFVGVWPSNISAIDLAWDSNDTAEEYTVEFQVQYFVETDDSNAPNGKPRKRRGRGRRGGRGTR